MLSQLTYGLTHIPEVIIPLFQSVGNWGYLCLFLITFMETGLVVFPWLPGESLIFVATSLSAVSTNQIHIEILLPGFFIAALLGDTVNYLIGTRLIKLPWLFKRLDGPNLEQARIFFQRHGIKSVIFGRFVPLIRTFVPLIAGSSGLKARRFLIGNLIGSALWVLLAGVAGYYFGMISFVKDQFSLVLLGLICVSFLPAAIVWGINRLRRHIIMKKGSF